MTAKKQAKELFDEFRVLELSPKDDVCKTFKTQGIEEAKQCALIAVDKIIKAIDDLQYTRKTDFWENVKEEIKKL